MSVLKRIIFIALLFSIFSCKPKDRLHEQLSESINLYLKENLPIGSVVDSVVILNIDSLNEYTFLYFYKDFVENSIEILNMEMNYANFHGDEDLANEKLEEIGKAISLSNSYDQKIANYSDPKSAPFKMFFVVTKTYYRDENGKIHAEDIGYPISNGMKVVEMKL
ncbi:MAG: hypothetical protein ACOXZK_01365 [Bacteroidales bacterium]|jgi:hypothetical protein|nr:hypothetical protein [Bacteroidales bacterium]